LNSILFSLFTHEKGAEFYFRRSPTNIEEEFSEILSKTNPIQAKTNNHNNNASLWGSSFPKEFDPKVDASFDFFAHLFLKAESTKNHKN